MNAAGLGSRQARAWRRFLLGWLASVGIASAVVVAQQNTVHPQPRAEELPSPTTATANGSQRVLRPEGTVPMVPDGFSVASYVELRGPRMMVYAPNGDLFVSSPTTNSIVVLRDIDNDGVFEARGVFADGETARRRRHRHRHRCLPRKAGGQHPAWGCSKARSRLCPTRRPAPHLRTTYGVVRAECACRLVSPSTMATCTSVTPTRSSDSSTGAATWRRGARRRSCSTCRPAGTRAATSYSIAPEPSCISRWARHQTVGSSHKCMHDSEMISPIHASA